MNKEFLHTQFKYQDGLLFWKIQPSQRTKVGSIAGGEHGGGYKKVRVNGKKQFIHRVVFMMHHGFLPKFIDHIDGNPSNNKIQNLREATHSQNIMNKRLQSNNSTGIRGVHFDKAKSKYAASITVQRIRIHLGYFDSFELAALCYAESAKKYHGEFARPINNTEPI